MSDCRYKPYPAAPKTIQIDMSYENYIFFSMTLFTLAYCYFTGKHPGHLFGKLTNLTRGFQRDGE